jgi:hypothetical protein
VCGDETGRVVNDLFVERLPVVRVGARTPRRHNDVHGSSLSRATDVANARVFDESHPLFGVSRNGGVGAAGR